VIKLGITQHLVGPSILSARCSVVEVLEG